MDYWIMVILLFLLLVIMIVLGISIYKKNKDLETVIPAIVVASLLFGFYALDIPFAMNGGKIMYLEEAPYAYELKAGWFQWINAEDKILCTYRKIDNSEFDKDAKYIVTYTPVTHSILSIESIADN